MQVLDDFFEQSNASCIRHEYDEPQSTFMSSRLVSSTTPRTKSPVNKNLLHDWPFERLNVHRILDFAIQHLDNTEFSPTNVIIMDDRTNQDSTCLLLSRNPLSDDPYDYLQVRSDFGSAVVVLRSIEVGCAGADTQFSTNYSGFDGILRISVREHAEATQSRQR